MTGLHLADNTVLVNFGLIERMDLLRRLLEGRCTWAATVAVECAESARRTELRQLLVVPEFLGTPLVIEEDEEFLLMGDIRERLRIPGDPDTRHLGEAESLAIISHRSLNAHFVTDDTGAMREARRMGVEVITTSSLLLLTVKVGWLTAQQCWDYFLVLEGHSRFLPGRPESLGELMVACNQVQTGPEDANA